LCRVFNFIRRHDSNYHIWSFDYFGKEKCFYQWNKSISVKSKEKARENLFSHFKKTKKNKKKDDENIIEIEEAEKSNQ
jgi:hypothetical protein